MILALAGVGTFAIVTERANQAAVDGLMTGPVAQAEVVGDFGVAAWKAQVQLYHLMATAANESDEKKIKSIGVDTAKTLDAMNGKLKALDDPAFDNGPNAQQLAPLKTAVASYIKQSKAVIDMADGDAGAALVLMMGATRSFTAMAQLVEDLTDKSKERRDNKIAANNAMIERQSAVLIAVILAMIAVGCVASLLIGRGISRPVVMIANAMKRMAEGDFDVALPNIRRKDEVGEISAAFNTAVGRLSDMIRGIADAAREVSSATAEISTSTTDLSQRTEEQAASLEETSASMEEISSIVKHNAENAQNANRSAAGTRTAADRGGEVIGQAVGAMARIEQSSHRISDIIGVIDEIARQTNLLALNAAVEAARAGDAGRGFAVVASEVRSLAQRSSQAAKDIKDLITSSNGQVKEGVDLVNKAGAALGEIVDSIKTVADVVSDIASASAEQSTGIEQVNKALTQMDEVTQQNSALVEENAATAKMLELLAVSMNERVSYFRLGGSGSDGATRPQAERFEEAKPVVTPIKAAPVRRAAAPVAPKRTASAARPRTVGATALKADEWQDF
jgi:methyl-accepting chemotaxis protein